MDSQTFERFRDIIYERCGIVLSDEKQSLLSSRIQKRIRAHGLENERAYLEIIEVDASGEELIQLIDAISTNTTYFWREAEHFALFANILKEWKSQNKSSYRIWCAASSFGQEPYTLAMQVCESLSLRNDSVRILATDISTKALKRAQDGVYADEDIKKLPQHLRQRYFAQVARDDDALFSHWSVNQELRSLILFKRLNLIEYPYPLKGPLDVIFCRNVMIYFDVPTRQRIIDEMCRVLAPGGFLFLSLSESLLGIQHQLDRSGPSVFRKRMP
jgi:chemotaxis protein methyltransferase CheR